MNFKDKDAYLWSVLPLSGVGGYPYPLSSDTTLPFEKKIKLYGIPYAGTYTSNLRLITFTSSSDVIISPGTFINLVSATAIFKIKWKVSEKTKIGFYTMNYLPNFPNPVTSLYCLIPTSKGIGLFDNCEGEFEITNYPYFCVVTEGDVAVELEIRYRQVDIQQNLPTKPYTPIIFAEWKCKPVMEQMLIENSQVITYPLPKYVDNALTKIAFLEKTAVSITLTDDPLTDLIPISESVLTEEFPGDYFPYIDPDAALPRRNIYDISMKEASIPADRRVFAIGGNGEQYFGLTLITFGNRNFRPVISFNVVTKSIALDPLIINPPPNVSPYTFNLNCLPVHPLLIPGNIALSKSPNSIGVLFTGTEIIETTGFETELVGNSTSFGMRFLIDDTARTFIQNGAIRFSMYIENIFIRYFLS